MLVATWCAVCGARGPSPCAACAATMRAAPSLVVPSGLVACHALLAYEGSARELVARLKYRNERASLPRLAVAMAALVPAPDVDVVTWVPTTAARRRARGFDQAELLARAVGRSLRRPVRRHLVRVDRAPQTGRHGEARRAGPCLRPRGGVDGRVLVVDDVCTTGATLTAAARALRGAGAREIRAVVAARTPPPAHDGRPRAGRP